MKWGPGVTHTAPGTGDLCTNGWIHYYSHPLLAVLLNPIHGDFTRPRLWAVKVSGKRKHDHGLKSGAANVTTVKEIRLPVVTTAQCIRFAILCALKVSHSKEFEQWAKNWLNGEDRSEQSAREAWAAAAAASKAWAAEAWAARAAGAARATVAEASAAAVAWAAWAASPKPLDLIALAIEACV
jgi:hypothetical protein